MAAIADGRVYLTDRVLYRGEENPENPFQRTPVRGSERIRCLDEKDGSTLWELEYPCRYEVSYASGPRATRTRSADTERAGRRRRKTSRRRRFARLRFTAFPTRRLATTPNRSGPELLGKTKATK